MYHFPHSSPIPPHAEMCMDNPVAYPQYSKRVKYTRSNPSWVNPTADIYVVHRPKAVCQYLIDCQDNR